MIQLPKRQIAHLHTHTEYSLLDGVKNYTEFLKAAKAKNIDTYAVTEHGNLASAMGFYMEAIKQDYNIKPIFGLEAYIVDDASIKDKESKSSHLILLAKNNIGFNNLLKLSNISWGDNFYYKPKIDYNNLYKHHKGLIATTACMGGVISNALRFNGYKNAKEKIYLLKDIFKDDIYLEIQLMEEVYGPDFERIIRKIKSNKDENLVNEKLNKLEEDKDIYIELLTRHISNNKIQKDYKEKMYELLGDSWLDQASVNKYMFKLAEETKTKYVLTGDCHYPLKGDHKLQDLIIRVGFGNYKSSRQGSDEKSQSSGRGYYSKELYVKDNKDFDNSRKKYHPYITKYQLVESIKNTHIIADQIKTELPIGQHQLPIFDLKTNPYYKNGDSKNDLFVRIIKLGFDRNIINSISKTNLGNYQQRLEFEIDTITKANFIDYFLIIEDIVRWSKENNIYCVARGSVAGSLAAYSLGITGIDPIPYNLLFERFLNPTRVSGERAKAADALPDIDLDFERFGRAKVKQYIIDKYGKDRVCTIGSYGTMGVKTLVKDFMRVLNYKIGNNQYDYQLINKITSSVDIGVKTIEECCESSSEFAKFYDDNKDWFEMYIRPLQGEIRSMSKHAAGVLITPTEYTDWVPVRTQSIDDEDESGKVVISQWEDVYCERRGLLKLDILGVKQLDVFHRCLQLIKSKKGIDIDLEKIDVNDVNVYKKFHKGDNYGVFQFNSKLQSEYMTRMKPNSIEDLCVSNAILRPGPMAEGAHEDFIKLKTGKEKPEYDHECVIPFLKSTFALCVYQEQIMQVAHALGGLSLAEADMMRSAIKKKDEKLMNPFIEKFIDGAQKKGLSNKHANHVWNKILAFSSYAFNKSHSATYALEGYYCQWLKTYYPNEFYAATLDFASDDIKKNENIYTHRYHAIENGLRINNPKINAATTRFTIGSNGSINWPLRAIKGVGDKAANEIKAVQPFSSFEEFYEKVNKRIVNKRVVQKLIFSDVFKKFGTQEEILNKYCKLKNDDIEEKYLNLNISDWKKIKDETLGYISDSYKDVFKENFSKNVMSYKQFNECSVKSKVCIGGLITKLRNYKARNGMMAFMTVEDKNEKYEIVAFASIWKNYIEGVRIGNIVEIKGIKDLSPRKELQVVIGNSGDKIYVLA